MSEGEFNNKPKAAELFKQVRQMHKAYVESTVKFILENDELIMAAAEEMLESNQRLTNADEDAEAKRYCMLASILDSLNDICNNVQSISRLHALGYVACSPELKPQFTMAETLRQMQARNAPASTH